MDTVAAAAAMLRGAKRPFIVAGAGVVLSDAVDECRRLAECLGAPVANSYLHNDSFPASHPLAVGPLGYQGWESAMVLVREADVILALGTRLNPFSTLPQHGIEYWTGQAKIIQVDSNPDMLGLAKPIDVGICGDARAVARQLLEALDGHAPGNGADDRRNRIATAKSAWLQKLAGWDHEEDDPGSTWNARAQAEAPDRMAPRQVLRALQDGLPPDAMVSTDIGNICAMANSYLPFEQPRSFFAPGMFGNCGYAFPSIMGAKLAQPERPAVALVGDGAFGISLNELPTCDRMNIPVTVVVFRNEQWGAEKKKRHPVVRRALRRHRARRPLQLRRGGGGVRSEGRAGRQHDRSDRRHAGGVRGPGRRHHHPGRGDGQQGARRPVPPRRDAGPGVPAAAVQGSHGHALTRGLGVVRLLSVAPASAGAFSNG